MNNLKPSKLFYSISEGQSMRFRNRVVAKIGWMLTLSILAIFFVYYKDGGDYLWIPILFFSSLLVYEFISTWNSEKILLTFIEIDIKESVVVIRGNRYDDEVINCRCDLSDFSIQLRKLLLGQILVPNYQLLFKCKGTVIIKQKGNSIWPRLKLENMEKEINSLLVGEKG